jgi:RsiW-degrading membrane proteinase PrsW (M82 family)
LLIITIIIVPIIEEISKAIGLRLVKSRKTEIEDGFIFGAIAGFAATENLIYGIRFWDH